LTLLAVVVVLAIAIGVGTETGFLPDATARPAGKIPSRQLRQLAEMGVTQPGENVLFFYSAAILGIRGDGNLFTDRRVISYHQTESGNLVIADATYGLIADIELESSGTWMEDSTITVTKDDGTWLVLYISTDSQGALFYKMLLEEWNKHRRAAEFEAVP
jgi:hypothetical protein